VTFINVIDVLLDSAFRACKCTYMFLECSSRHLPYQRDVLELFNCKNSLFILLMKFLSNIYCVYQKSLFF